MQRLRRMPIQYLLPISGQRLQGHVKQLQYLCEKTGEELMLKLTILLDVDETCAISNTLYGQQDGGYRYNDALFSALKHSQCTEIYFFTSYNLSSVSSVLQDESVGAPSRLKLIQYLENQGFKVQGVMTLLDVVFKQGIGAYYEQ